MPILALGNYSIAVLSDFSSSFIETTETRFYYLPIRGVIYLGWIAFFLLVVRSLKNSRPGPDRAKHVVFIPAWFGLTLLLVPFNFLRFFSIPLLYVTAIYLLWRVLRIRSWLAGAILALVLGVGLAAGVLAFGDEGLGSSWLIIMSLFLGGLVALPVAGVRVAIRATMSWKRLVLGSLPGIVLATIAITTFALWQRPPAFIAFLTAVISLAYSCGTCLMFCLLLRWNSWARGVGTGEMFQSKALVYSDELSSPE